MSEKALQILRERIDPHAQLMIGQEDTQALWDACQQGADKIAELQARVKELEAELTTIKSTCSHYLREGGSMEGLAKAMLNRGGGAE